MRNKSKRFLSLLLAFCLTLTMSAPALAADDTAGGGQPAVTDQPDTTPVDPSPADPDAPADSETGGQIDGETPDAELPPEGETSPETPPEGETGAPEEIPSETPEETPGDTPAEEPLVLEGDLLAVEAATEWRELASVAWYSSTEDVFEIATEQQLAGLAKLVNAGNTFTGKTIYLTADLDLSGKNWTPIGYSTNGSSAGYLFDGVFDGGGYTISGLQVTEVGYTSGLFGFIKGSAVIRNLNLFVESSTATGANAVAAGLIGVVSNAEVTVVEEGTVHDCRVTVNGVISTKATSSWGGAGAIGGVFWKGSVLDCFVDITEGAKIYGSAVKGTNNVGGYIGYTAAGCVIERSRVWIAGDIEGEASTTTTIPAVGGFAGTAGGIVKDCYAIIEATGSIKAKGDAKTLVANTGYGGLMGRTNASTQIMTSYVVNKGTGNISTDISGGLLAGGVEKANLLTVSNCYAWTASESDNYQLSGSNNIKLNDCVLWASESAMKQQSTYDGFDFTGVWVMDAVTGYPVIGTEATLTDEQIVASIRDNLTFETIQGENQSETTISRALTLPSSGLKGAKIAWKSSLPAVIGPDGKVTLTDAAQDVMLTATITYRTATAEKAFTLKTVTFAEVTEWSDMAETTWYDASETVFEVKTVQQLAGLAELVNAGNTFTGKTIHLAADLDLSGKNWTPIGYSTDGQKAGYLFDGVFDGGGHTIRGLEVKTVGYTAGLFGYIKGSAVIRNLNLIVESSTATATNAVAAGLIGVVSNAAATVGKEGTVHDCRITVNGTISATSTTGWTGAGAIGGVFWKGSVFDCFVDIPEGAKIYGNAPKSQNNVGGYIGFTNGGCVIERSRAWIAGSIEADASTTTTNPAVGGFAGMAGGTVKDCYAIIESTGSIKAKGSAATAVESTGYGGLVGWTSADTQVVTSYVVNKGTGNLSTNISGGLLAGGVYKTNLLTVSNCYAWTASESDNYKLSGSGNIKLDNCVLLSNESAMKQQSTYAGFDFANTWVMDTATGYPIIGSEAELTDAQVIAAVKGNLSFDTIKGANTDQNAIAQKLALPTSNSLGATLTWSSSNPKIVSADGDVVPVEAATQVTLTATIQSGTLSDTWTITVTTVSSSTITEWSLLADSSWYDAAQSDYTITSASELAGLAKLVNAGNTFNGKIIHLTADLDLSGKNWTPIGYSTNGSSAGYLFDGVFDGGGYTISGLQVTEVGYTSGLFGFIKGSAVIRNLNLFVESSTATGANAVAAGLIGVVSNAAVTVAEEGTVHDCRVTVNGVISTKATSSWGGAGAIGGVFWKGSVRDCFVDIAAGAKIYGSAVKSTNNVGGYIGFTGDGCVIERSRALVAGDIEGEASTTTTIPAVGGFAGYAGGMVKDCYAIIEPTGSVKAKGSAATAATNTGYGGLVGWTNTNTQVITSYVINKGTGNLSTDISGGLIAGGVEKANLLTVNNCYAWTVSASDNYQLSGSDNIKLNDCVLLPSESAMKQQSTYAGFDFAETWVMDRETGYPKIGTELSLSDEEIVAAVKANLTFDRIRGNNTAADQIKYKLVLPDSGVKGAAIAWHSDKPQIIGADGRVVPVDESTTAQVNLTATITSGAATDTVTFALTVVPGLNWDRFWRAYWADPAHDDAVIDTVGDSITSSQMSFTGGLKFYYEWIQERLNGELGKHVTVVNPAIGGWKMNQFNAAAQEWVVNYQPDIVTVYFGMNDRSTATATFNAEFDGLMEQIIPSAANVAAGAPEDRVIVLISCNPVRSGADGLLRTEHAYGEALAEKYQAQGYKVQYVDLYDFYKTQLPYGNNGNLASYSNYMNDDLHVNGVGNYATAQFIMKNIGLFDENSALCNIPHNTVLTTKNAPNVSLNYFKAETDLNGEEFQNALKTSPGFTEAAASNAYGSILMLGGKATSAAYMEPGEYRSYTWHLESYLRTTLNRSYRHGITVASEDYDVAWFNQNFDALKARYHNPSFILYMPEVNELYSDAYEHSAAKVEAYGAALDTFVKKCGAAGIKLTLATPFPMQDATKNGYLKEYAQKVIDVAEANGTSVSNLYSVFDDVNQLPQVRRNWYTEDGMPNHIAHVEAAKAFLTGTYGSLTGLLAGYTYRNGSTNSGDQRDQFPVMPMRKGDTITIDLTELLADPLYSKMTPTAASFALEKKSAGGTMTTITPAFDVASKVLTYQASDVAENDTVTLIIKNGTNTYLMPYTGADIMVNVAITGTISSYNARTMATLALYKQESGVYSKTAAATETIAAAETTTCERAENAFTFSTIEPGTYKLVVEKAGHQSYVLEGITVGDTDVTLTNVLKLLCGDVNGDGYIDMRDREVINTAMFTLLLEDRTAADLNGDGLVNFLDLNIVMQTEHFNRQPKVYQAA